MDEIIFYAPDIVNNPELPEEEAMHCVRVLRKKEGDKILITDGKGWFYQATLVSAHQKHCVVSIYNTIEQAKPWKFGLQMAFAPTKNIDRIEWFAEKATEIGVDHFTPILSQHSERKVVKLPRIEKILVSAMKQSQKAVLPKLDELTDLKQFIEQEFSGRKFIAHCYPQDKKTLKEIYKQGEDAVILIGPEGDFSEEEVALALLKGFEPVSLGESRLRTETAALVACHTLHVLNM